MKHFTDQKALTVISKIDDALLQTLDGRLTQINANIVANDLLPFGKINGIHFCRFVMLPEFTDPKGKRIPFQLVYSSNLDDSLETHFQEIRKSGTSSGFAALFSCCSNYNRSLSPEDAVEDFIRKNEKKVQTFYRGYRGLTVDIIQAEKQVYQTIQDYLEIKTFNGVPAAEVKNDIEAHIRSKWPDRKASLPVKLPNFNLIKTAILLLARLLWPLAVLLIIFYFLGIIWYGVIALVVLAAAAVAYLYYLEHNDPELDAADKNYDKIRMLSSMEDKIVQNQLTHLAHLKAGLFRRCLQRFALFALDTLATYMFNKGDLGGIGSIHFARWSMIDKGRRLLFFSNFDGSWENYLGDFVDRAALGLTLAWSNNKEFPVTRWLATKGATNEELFKSWARKYQQPTQVWYSAYKDLTVKNIYRNHKIALGIGQTMNDTEIKEWLKLL